METYTLILLLSVLINITALSLALINRKTAKNNKKHVTEIGESLSSIDVQRIETVLRERVAEIGDGIRIEYEQYSTATAQQLKNFSKEHNQYTLRMEELEGIVRKHLNRANTREARANKAEEMQQRIDELQEIILNQGIQELDPTVQEPQQQQPPRQPRLVRRA